MPISTPLWSYIIFPPSWIQNPIILTAGYWETFQKPKSNYKWRNRCLSVFLSVCLSFHFLNNHILMIFSSKRLQTFVLLRTQGNAMSTVMVFGWAVLIIKTINDSRFSLGRCISVTNIIDVPIHSLLWLSFPKSYPLQAYNKVRLNCWMSCLSSAFGSKP